MDMSRMAVTASLAAAARLSQERRDAEAMPSTSVSFPTAAQPEIMRAAEKDEQYLKHVCDACFDTVRHLMGIGVAIKYSAEIKMAGAALYHACTTGMGLQTLGEEYCDIMQVDEGRGLLPSIRRRTAMILLETAMPYAINRLSTQVSARGLALALQDNPEPSGSQMPPLGSNVGNAAAMNRVVEGVQPSQSGDTGILPSTHSSSSGNNEPWVNQDNVVHSQDHGGDGVSPLASRWGRVYVSGAGTDSIGDHHPHQPLRPQHHQHHQRHHHHRHHHQHHRQVAPSLSSGPVWFRVKFGLLLLRLRTSIWARARGRWEAFLRHWPPLVRRLKESFGLVMRLHLMMFYFHGLYFHLSKRVTSIQYIYTGKSSEQRPRYSVLGMFLLIQLVVVGGDWFQRYCIPTFLSYVRAQRQSRDGFRPDGRTGAVVLDEDGQEIQEKSRSLERELLSANDAEAPVSSKCALCLSVRQHSTATPCGHVFCWSCIAEWGNEKKECPLCRSPFTHSTLVCVYHSDF